MGIFCKKRKKILQTQTILVIIEELFVLREVLLGHLSLAYSKEEFMYVCICHDIKDSQLKTAMTQGIDTMDALKETLGVATCCGCCEPMVQDLLDEHRSTVISINAMDVMAS